MNSASCLLSQVFVVSTVGGMPELNSKLSAGEQDLLAGSGTVEGEDGQKPPFNIRCYIICAALNPTFVLCSACGLASSGPYLTDCLAGKHCSAAASALERVPFSQL